MDTMVAAYTLVFQLTRWCSSLQAGVPAYRLVLQLTGLRSRTAASVYSSPIDKQSEEAAPLVAPGEVIECLRDLP